MTYRSIAWILAITLIAATSATTAFAGKWINQFNRWMGYGYSDGYHAGKQEVGGESVLVEPGAVGPVESAPTSVPQPSSEPIEPRPELLPKPPRQTGLPSRLMIPSPSTTGDSQPQLRTRWQERTQGGVISRFKGRDRKPGEPTPADANDGLTAPQIEGPSINIEGPSLAPPATPAADGSIDPYPEAPPAATGPSTTRPRYLPPPR